MYQLIQNSKGNRYMKDKKFISEKQVPEVWKRILNNKDVITGEPATHKRLVSNVMMTLSDDSYYSAKVTVGFLTGLLRKEENGIDQETPVGSQTERSVSPERVGQGQDAQ